MIVLPDPTHLLYQFRYFTGFNAFILYWLHYVLNFAGSAIYYFTGSALKLSYQNRFMIILSYPLRGGIAYPLHDYCVGSVVWSLYRVCG